MARSKDSFLCAKSKWGFFVDRYAIFLFVTRLVLSLLIFFLKIPIRILFGCKIIKIMKKTLRIQEYFVNL